MLRQPLLPLGVLELALHSAATLDRAIAKLDACGEPDMAEPLRLLRRILAWERVADAELKKSTGRAIVDEFLAPPDAICARVMSDETRSAVVDRIKRSGKPDFFVAAKRELMRCVAESPPMLHALTGPSTALLSAAVWFPAGALCTYAL